jgi:hypothetical protein
LCSSGAHPDASSTLRTHGQPEIQGYTKGYLEASSPRREQIKDHLREQGIDGAAAAQIAAHHTRDRKELLSLKKSYSATASWPHSMGIRRTVSSPKRANTGSIGCKTRRCKRSGP